MAKNIDHILHKKSNVVTNGIPKAPTSGSVEYGEIAVNYAADNETLFIRNSNDLVVPFARVTVEDKQRWNDVASSGVTDVDASGMSASIEDNTLIIDTNATKVKLDDFQHDAQNATTAYTNESGVSTSCAYTVDWNLTTSNGNRLETGVYLYRVNISCEGSHKASKARKLIVVGNK